MHHSQWRKHTYIYLLHLHKKGKQQMIVHIHIIKAKQAAGDEVIGKEREGRRGESITTRSRTYTQAQHTNTPAHSSPTTIGIGERPRKPCWIRSIPWRSGWHSSIGAIRACNRSACQSQHLPFVWIVISVRGRTTRRRRSSASVRNALRFPFLDRTGTTER